MRVFSIQILYKGAEGKVNPLFMVYELSSFGYFQRGSVQEFMSFTSKIIVERTAVCSRASVKQQDYLCHVYVRSDSLSGVVIADNDYPQRVAHTLLNMVLEEFEKKLDRSLWSTVNPSVSYPELNNHLQKYQDPKEADALTKLKCDLDETKIILYNTIEAVLAREEKLDTLVEKSEGLSLQSKAFYKTARKTNQCCVIL